MIRAGYGVWLPKWKVMGWDVFTLQFELGEFQKGRQLALSHMGS